MSVFKRKQTDETYSYKFRFQGKQILRSTPFTAKEDAEKAERDHRFALTSGKFEVAAQLRSKKPVADTTLGQIITAYLQAPVEASATTRRGNVNCLRNIVRVVQGSDITVAWESLTSDCALSASIINADLAGKWFAAALKKINATSDQLEQGSLRRTANSIMRQAKSLFTPRALNAYKKAGLALPSVQDFLAAADADSFTKAVKKDYNPPAESIIQKTLEDWKQLEDRNLFLAIGHALAFGMRKEEIAIARWSWHATRDGVPLIDATAAVKGQTGFIQIRALDPFFTILINRAEAMGWRGKPDDYILSAASDTQRHESIFRDVSKWMRARGWQTQKAIHEWRAYAGSQVALRYDIYEASRWLRHSSVKVTELNYARYVGLVKPSDVTKLPCKWAEAVKPIEKQEFIPQVLAATI